ncbi:MAG: CoA-binding protein [Chloroflexota bacterium]|nr:CoA-binding protein [Chloroflexota bacterium]
MSQVLERFEPLFKPRSVTFVGASKSPMKWGFIVLANLVHGGYQGKIYPINPHESEILGLKVYRSVAEVPEVSDLAVIVTPPSSVPQVVADCVAKGISAGVVITAGFAEVGDEGKKMQQEMGEIARKSGMVLVGPNCNGIMHPVSKLYPVMPPVFPGQGPFAVVSQSGNVAVSITSRGMTKGFGISHFVSCGNEAHLNLADFIEYFGEDPGTRVILSYIEGVRDARRFLDVARRVTQTKPIIAIKAGGTAAGARAALSHTAALSGSEAVFAAAARQAGIIMARDIDEVFNIGAAFIRQPLPRGKRVGIVTAGGGWGVLAADACARAGLDVRPLPEETLKELDSVLPPWWSHGNPVDLVAGMRDGDVKGSLEALMRCPEIDGVICLGLRGSPAPAQTGDRPPSLLSMMTSTSGDMFNDVLQMMDRYQKPIILASDTAFGDVDMSRDLATVLGEKQMICYSLPDQAAAAFASLAQYGEYMRENGHQ